MHLVWKVPSDPPDSAAITRMRHSFPQPEELMPEPWFMGETIYFYEFLATAALATISAKEFCRAINDIAGGIFCFPHMDYVATWKAWFKYLLPDMILRADDPANFNSYDLDILVNAITACFNVYPQQIAEEYPGFRDDLVSMLGVRAIPQRLARERLAQSDEFNPLFADIWDETFTIANYGFVSYEEVRTSMLFCLKYLTVSEIADWADSLFQINSPQWHLQTIKEDGRADVLFLMNGWLERD